MTVLCVILAFIVGHAVGYFWMKRKLAQPVEHEHVYGPWEDTKIRAGGYSSVDGQQHWCVSCNYKEIREVA